MKNKSVNQSVRNIRYLPIVCFAIMFSHVIMLLLGIDCPMCEISVIVLGFYIAYSFSKALGFCFTHRMCIYYALSVMACIWLRRFTDGEFGIFGSYIVEARIFMFIYGLIVAFMLYRKHIKG